MDMDEEEMMNNGGEAVAGPSTGQAEGSETLSKKAIKRAARQVSPNLLANPAVLADAKGEAGRTETRETKSREAKAERECSKAT